MSDDIIPADHLCEQPSADPWLKITDPRCHQAMRHLCALYKEYLSHAFPRPVWLAREAAYAMAHALLVILELARELYGSTLSEETQDALEGIASDMVVLLKDTSALIPYYDEALRRHHLYEWRLFTQNCLQDIPARLAECLHALPYKQYLQTRHWSAVRKQALVDAHYRCQVCNSTGTLNVHHRTYARRGREFPRDLIALCRSCHTLFHKNGTLAPSEEAEG